MRHRRVASILFIGGPLIVLVVVVVAAAKSVVRGSTHPLGTHAATAARGSATRGAPQRSGHATWTPIGPGAFTTAGCEPRAAITKGFFQLGPTFRGLRASRPFVECMPPRSRIAVDGPLRPVGYVYLSYGTCNFHLEPCQDPLEIQTWAECSRDPNSYTPERGSAPPLDPSQLVKVRAAPELPATSFNGGTRLELYGGGSTVVIFAPDATLAARAAQALARAVFRHASPTSEARLDSEASAPGNATTCHHLLAPASRTNRTAGSQ